MRRIKFNLVLLICFVFISETILYSLEAKDIFKDEKVIELIKSVKAGNDKVVRQLLEEGINIDSEGTQKITPLYYFFLKKDYKSFKKLLELGANPDVDPEGLGMYCLINASMTINDDRFFKSLLEHNVNVNYIPENSEPVLKFSLSYTVNIKYLKMLLEHGIKLTYSDNLRSSPLLTALTYREYKRVILLLEYGAELNDRELIKLYKREITQKELFIDHLENYTQAPGSKLLKEQQELVKYLKDKYGIEVHLKYPEGRKN